jgi:peptidoglycan/LPS O-acetylase OafA/YrhL
VKASRWVPWVIWLAALAAVLAAIWSGAVRSPDQMYTRLSVFGTLTGGVGALVASRKPSNPIGWMILGVGVFTAWGFVTEILALDASNRQLALWLTHLTWWPPLGIYLIVLPLLFPDGAPPSRRWRPLLIAAIVGVAAFTLYLAVGPYHGASFQFGRNPYHQPLISPVALALSGMMLPGVVGAVASVVVRFRRSRGVERQQIKWIMYSVFLLLLSAFATALPVNQDITFVAFGIAGFLVPVSVGIAVLRYRLYDIDRLISRTVSYSIVVGSLAAVFTAIAIWLPQLLRVPEENPFLVAGATLAVAALFNPLRRRVQAIVDRRFNRARYDAQQEVERLA